MRRPLASSPRPALRLAAALLLALGLSACSSRKPSGSTAAQTGAPQGPQGAPAGSASAEEKCLDAWLEAHQLDAYGQPRGTLYVGGTPLFDERTGVTTPRADYVYARQPAARGACAASKR